MAIAEASNITAPGVVAEAILGEFSDYDQEFRDLRPTQQSQITGLIDLYKFSHELSPNATLNMAPAIVSRAIEHPTDTDVIEHFATYLSPEIANKAIVIAPDISMDTVQRLEGRLLELTTQMIKYIKRGSALVEILPQSLSSREIKPYQVEVRFHFPPWVVRENMSDDEVNECINNKRIWEIKDVILPPNDLRFEVKSLVDSPDPEGHNIGYPMVLVTAETAATTHVDFDGAPTTTGFLADAYKTFFSSKEMAPRFANSRVGERIDRAVGMLAGGIRQVSRTIEEMGPSMEIQKAQLTEMMQVLGSVMNSQVQPQVKVASRDEIIHSAEAFAHATDRLVDGEESPLEKKIREGFAVALRGYKQVVAFNRLGDLRDFNSLSVDEVNEAWVLSQLGMPVSEIQAYLDKAKGSVTSFVEGLTSQGDKKRFWPDMVITADEEVSPFDLPQLTAFALPKNILSNRLSGNDVAHIHVSQRGLNHFTFAIDRISAGGKRETEVINFGATFAGSYVDTLTQSVLPVRANEDAALLFIRDLGHIDLTDSDAQQQMDRTVLHAAHALKWNPRQMHEDPTDNDYDATHYLRPLRDNAPSFTESELLNGGEKFQGAREFVVGHYGDLPGLITEDYVSARSPVRRQLASSRFLFNEPTLADALQSAEARLREARAEVQGDRAIKEDPFIGIAIYPNPGLGDRRTIDVRQAALKLGGGHLMMIEHPDYQAVHVAGYDGLAINDAAFAVFKEAYRTKGIILPGYVITAI